MQCLNVCMCVMNLYYWHCVALDQFRRIICAFNVLNYKFVWCVSIYQCGMYLWVNCMMMMISKNFKTEPSADGVFCLYLLSCMFVLLIPVAEKWCVCCCWCFNVCSCYYRHFRLAATQKATMDLLVQLHSSMFGIWSSYFHDLSNFYSQ